MKYLLSAIAFLMLTAMSCKKDKASNKEDLLPPITQTGAKTFGCLVNGKVYIPKGSNGSGTPNYRAIYELFNGRYYFKVLTERYTNNSFDGEIYFSIDSCNQIGTYPIRANKNRIVYGGGFFGNCGISGFDTTTYQSGSFTVTKLDISNGIFSGTFFCNIKPANCDTIRITEGRFDYKF
ncbi:MAG: hypothetical protein JWP69_1439 [Flaviaesturariibacter sp.]|nr:hypothetical protein [Flaviaesturariibacter sp.]